MCQDCAVLYEKMKSQENEMYQLKNALRNKNAELRFERRQKEKILKEKKKVNHYKNGQKRGAHGRHG